MGLTFDADVLVAVRSLPPTAKKAVREALDRLADDPSGLDLRQLETAEPGPAAYRVRVGDYRIVFLAFPGETRVIRVFHRSEGYGWLERMG